MTIEELKAWIKENSFVEYGNEFIGINKIFKKIDEVDTSAERKLADHVSWLRDNIQIEEEEADEYIYNTHEDRKKAFEEALENLDEELTSEPEGEE